MWRFWAKNAGIGCSGSVTSCLGGVFLGDFLGNFALFCALFGKNGVVLCVSSAAKLGAPNFVSLS
jgi:hypothetical protein